MKKPKKDFNLFVVFAHCIIGGVLIGTAVNNAFIADTWFGPVFASFAPWLNFVISVAFGLLIGAGSYGLFIHSEEAKKTIRRIKDKWERTKRLYSLVGLEFLFVGAGIAGLVYRLLYVNTKGVAALVIIGIILEVSVPLFGNVLHPIQHPDIQVLEDSLMDEFERDTLSESFGAMKQLPLPKKYRAYTGDFESALDEAVNDLEEEEPEPRRRPLTSRRGVGRRSVSMEPTRALPDPSSEEEEEFNPFFEGLQEKNRAKR